MSPARKSPPSAIVGIDIGSDAIKLVEARYAKDGITITGLGVARTPAGSIDNEVIVDPEGLAKAVKTLLTESGIKTRKCVSSVSGQSRVVVRVIEVPKMSRDELIETMKWEIERHVPFPPDQVVKDFQPLDKPGADPNAQNMEVLLAVAQEELIDRHVETLLAAGLQPVAIDVEPLAASRCLIDAAANGKKDDIVAIVNIGAHNTDLSVFEDGILTFPSPPLGIAGVNFTREIAEALGQSLEQAEVTKREYAAVNLAGFGAASAAAVSPGAGLGPAEPTSFDTSFGPGLQLGTAFDLGGGDAAAAAEPEPAADGQAGPGLDLAAGAGGPAFDLGSEPPAPAGDAEGTAGEQPADQKPAFDLDGEEQTSIAGPVFDLGAPEPAAAEAPAAPTFDLDDQDEAAHAEPAPAPPTFDLGDTDAHASPGEPAPFELSVAAPSHEPGSMEERVFQAISGVLTDLATELRRSLEYYSTRYAKSPTSIILCGGTAKMPKLDEFLAQELGLPVRVADPVKTLRVKVTGVSEQYLREISPLFPVSMGLAIRDMIG